MISKGKYEIPKDNLAVLSIYSVHRDERYYPDPEKFDPDRFLPENSKNRPAYAFIPFAGGRRSCLGQRYAHIEEKIVLANIMRKFEITSFQTTEELNPLAEIICRPLNPGLMKLKIR